MCRRALPWRIHVLLCIAAEDYLRQHETQVGFAQLVMRAIESPGTPPELQQAASVLLKNFVKVSRGYCVRCGDAARRLQRGVRAETSGCVWTTWRQWRWEDVSQ